MISNNVGLGSGKAVFEYENEELGREAISRYHLLATLEGHVVFMRPHIMKKKEASEEERVAMDARNRR